MARSSISYDIFNVSRIFQSIRAKDASVLVRVLCMVDSTLLQIGANMIQENQMCSLDEDPLWLLQEKSEKVTRVFCLAILEGLIILL